QRKLSDVSTCKDLPDEIPLPLIIGTKVTGKITHMNTLYLQRILPQSHDTNEIMFVCLTARLRGVHDGLFTGQIDAVDTSAATYRVTFDRSGLGTHTVPDYEVLVKLLPSCDADEITPK
ncbi:Protein lin-9, partial [Xenoophorus captivus]